MHDIMPYLALAVVLLTGWGIIKKVQVNVLLLFAGIALNVIALMGGVDNILPKNGRPTGAAVFDIFALLTALSKSQVAGVGFVILIAGGFAAYMDKIGASDKLVAVCLKPLQKLKSPYLILGAVFLLGHLLGLVVTSAAGLAMLLAVSVYPLLLGLGISGAAAGAVLGTVLVLSYAPTSAIAILSANSAHLDPIDFLVHYQLPVGATGAIVVAVMHVIVQAWYDRKDRAAGKLVAVDPAEIAAKGKRAESTPLIYALLPLIPLILLFIFNKMVYKTVLLDVPTAMFFSWTLCILIDMACRRSFREATANGFAMFQGMGKMLTSVVGLIFVAALFAAGLKNAGLVGLLIDAAKHAGLGFTGTSVIMSGVVGVITLLTGSGVAAFTGLIPVAPQIAQSFSGDPAVLALMLQIGSEYLRPLSPVAGVVIIVAGFANVSPMAIVRRTWLPCLCGALAASVVCLML